MDALREADSEAMPELLAAVLAELARVSEARPETEADLMRIFDDRLRADVDQATWQALMNSLASYIDFGMQLVFAVTWPVTMPDEVEALRDLERREPDGARFLRRVLGIHGTELRRAFLAWDRSPRDWTNLLREVYLDLLTGTHQVNITIEQYSGASFRIEGDADSIMTLARHLVLTLRQVGSKDAFSPARIDEFLSDTQPFIEMLTASEATEATKAGTAAAALDAAPEGSPTAGA